MRRPARRRAEVATRTAPAPAQRSAASTRPAAPKRRPLRSLATLAIVAGLVAAVGIPAYGALVPETDAKTIQQAAEEGAQSLIVASEVKSSVLQRDSYSATTEAEIAKKKAAAAAAARAKMLGSTASVNIDLSLVGPGTGPVRWPLAKITRIGDGFMSRGGAHHGVDLISPGGTPIFASTSGVVRVSQESYYGYGVAIVIDGVIDGRKVSTLYSHMRYGSRTVGVGTHVQAGQVIGLVGATGRAFGNHLHFEVKINGSLVDPIAFLRANAG
ncbi:M23 family metallopeptidase [Microbacterium sp.]|uniref:M23 family metallopeptidase n=1 Tax=Microbacterium sp. TaxID=51671 RepID=UPI0037C5B880